MTPVEKLQQADQLLSEWLTDNTLDDFGEVPEIDEARSLVQDAIEMLAAPAQLEDIEQYRLQMAAISTAALGYWKKGDDIHPDYVTPALHDVADLYAKYDGLFKQKAEQPAPAQEPLTDEQIVQVLGDVREAVSGNVFLTFARAIEAAHGIKEKNT